MAAMCPYCRLAFPPPEPRWVAFLKVLAIAIIALAAGAFVMSATMGR